MKKVCYGLAFPGLVVGCVLNTHLPAKYSEYCRHIAPGLSAQFNPSFCSLDEEQ